MNTVYLDCLEMTDRELVHDCLAQALRLPPWYGRNLDALFDLLCSLPPTRLILAHVGALDGLGPYGHALVDTLRNAALENPDLELLSARELEGF